GSLSGRAVKNELGCRIHRLIVNDKTQMLEGADIADGATGALVPHGDWEKLFVDNDPKELDSTNPGQMQNLLTFITRGPNWFGYYNSSTDPTKSLLEVNCDAAKRSQRKPGEFIAVVDRPKEVVIGVEGSREVAGFHVIRGAWQP